MVRRRLFEDLGDEKRRRKVARAYADWCFERTARLPPEWLAVDTATKGTKARDFLRERFEACYPFPPLDAIRLPAKMERADPVPADPWHAGDAGAMDFLGRARAVPTGADRTADHARVCAAARARIPRRDPRSIGRSPGSMSPSTPTSRGRPRMLGRSTWTPTGLCATSTDGSAPRSCSSPRAGRWTRWLICRNCASRSESLRSRPRPWTALRRPWKGAGFFIRKVGTDGFRIHHQATLKKVVSDRRASLDEEAEIRPAIRKMIESEFARGADPSGHSLSRGWRCRSGFSAPDDHHRRPRDGVGRGRHRRAHRPCGPGNVGPRRGCTRARWSGARRSRDGNCGTVWSCGSAWGRVEREVGGKVCSAREFDRADRAELRTKVKDAESAARDEVWGGLPFRGPRGQEGRKRSQGHRSWSWSQQRQRNALRPRRQVL